MPADLQKARGLFLHAVGKLPAEKWDDYLAEACGDDSGLMQQVKHLLRVHLEAGSFLESPVVAPVGMDNPSTPSETAGSVIGPYKLLEQIGEGGMGSVFMAEQTDPVRRKVALKIIKPGMDSKQVVARFEAERQALALMDHPNIARVIDAGATASGRPYFAMELVRGLPITDYCDQAQLSIPDRLGLFVQVCRAVQHAHQKGVIHRDLKPSNVLVTVIDGTPVPKVIDFGVVKATGVGLTDRTLFTGFHQLVGTPMYMSPEQAELSGVDVDTRTDVYALGVLLYELLTGSTPFDPETIRKAGLDELRRMIREDEPQRPSKRVSTLAAEQASTVADRRRVDPRRFEQLMRHELDWVVMRALEKDRNRRYESASALAADVQRYLNNEAVEACPPGTLYRVRKFAKRHNIALFTSSLVLAVLVAATVVSVWYALEADRAQTLAGDRLEDEKKARVDADVQSKRADENYRRARAAVKQMLTRVATEEVGRIREMSAIRRKLLEDAVAFYTELLRLDPRDAEAHYERGKVYRRLVKFDEAVRDFRTAAELDPTHLGCQVELGLFFSDWYKRDLRQALVHLSRAVELDSEGRTSDDPDSSRVNIHFLMMRTHAALGNWEESRKWLGSYVALLPASGASAILAGANQPEVTPQDAIRYARQAIEQDPNEPWAYYHLATNLTAVGNYKEALTAISDAIRVYPRQNDYELAVLYHTRADLYHVHLSNDEAALADYNRAIELDPLTHYWVHKRRGLILFRRGEYGKALAEITKAVELKPEDGSNVTWIAPDKIAACPDAAFRQGMIDLATRAISLTNGSPGAYVSWARLFLAMKIGAETAEEVEMVLTSFRSRLEEQNGLPGPGNENTKMSLAALHVVLGVNLHNSKQYTEAETQFREAIRANPDFFLAHGCLGLLLNHQGRFDEAVASYRKAIELEPDYHQALNNLAWLLATCPDPKLRNPVEAVELAKRAVAVKPSEGGSQNTLGVCYYRAGNWKAAVYALGKSVEFNKGGNSFDFFFMAMALWQMGDEGQARKWYDEAVRWMDKNNPEHAELRRFRAETAELLNEKPGDTKR